MLAFITSLQVWMSVLFTCTSGLFKQRLGNDNGHVGQYPTHHHQSNMATTSSSHLTLRCNMLHYQHTQPMCRPTIIVPCLLSNQLPVLPINQIKEQAKGTYSCPDRAHCVIVKSKCFGEKSGAMLRWWPPKHAVEKWGNKTIKSNLYFFLLLLSLIINHYYFVLFIIIVLYPHLPVSLLHRKDLPRKKV